MSAASTAAGTLIVAAHELELAPLRARLGDGVRTAVVGVGMAAAGGGTARALAHAPARRLVLVGSCGSYPERGLARLSLFAPHALVAVDAAELEGRAAFPDAMAHRCACDPALHGGLVALPGVRDGVLATTLGITTDDALARAIAAGAGCDAENLEALAVALACAARAVPFAALLCSTNDVGARGRAQWLEHHARAAELTADALAAWLSAG